MTDDLNKDLEQELENEPNTASDDVVVDEDAELSTPDVIKKLREKLKIAVEEKQKYLDGWQRDKAEFVNIRKREEESRKDYVLFATEKVIEDILPVLDAFDFAMANKVSWESAPVEWRTGVEGIYHRLIDTLGKHEVKPFGTVGDTFDPNLHHSISMVPTEDKTLDHTVAEILQKGYNIREKVLRPALVKVYEA